MADEIKKKSDEEPMGKLKIKGGIPLIGGGGLIALIEELMGGLYKTLPETLPKALPEDASPCGMGTPLNDLDDSDFDSEDETVETFKNDGGVKSIIRITKISDKAEAVLRLSELSSRLRNVRSASRLRDLRQAFASIEAARQGKGAQHQIEAVELLDKLAKDAGSDKERISLANARKAVLIGTGRDFEAAGFRVRTSFASLIPTNNVKLAYTSLSTQDGEPNLLCPKAVKQLGYAVPMEVSKCRQNCIDSRVSKDGRVACAYAEWLKTADTHQAAMGRLEMHRGEDNEFNLLTLAENQRSKPLTKDERTYEERFKEELDNFGKEPDDRSIEQRLHEATKAELGHHGEPDEKDRLASKNARRTVAERIDAESDESAAAQVNKAHVGEIDDETMEEMLADERVGLAEDDLDKVLDAFLKSQRKYE
jgi:hypothetical protein